MRSDAAIRLAGCARRPDSGMAVAAPVFRHHLGFPSMKRPYLPWPTKSTRSGCSGSHRHRVFSPDEQRSLQDDPRRATILKKHIARIDDPRLRHAFQAVVDLESQHWSAKSKGPQLALRPPDGKGGAG